MSETGASYYGHPLLKSPTWIWSIPAYFYVGGVAGAGAAFGAAAQLLAMQTMRPLVKRSRWIGTVGGAVSAALLIHDLGRPSRFLNMLRVFRVTSPMSMGSWILTAFSNCVAGAALLPETLAAPLGIASGVLGLGLSSYTGVLLAQTAVPVWKASYRTLPLLFLASGSASAAACFELLPLNRIESAAVERFGLCSKVLELLAALALEREAARTPRAAKPLKTGLSGWLWQSAKVMTAAGIVLALAPGSESRRGRVTSGILGTLAGLALRFGIFYAGKASAKDPRASFEQQHQIPAERAPILL